MPASPKKHRNMGCEYHCSGLACHFTNFCVSNVAALFLFPLNLDS